MDRFETTPANPFYEALSALDAEIAKCKDLVAAGPLKMLSAGGFVALVLFHNRLSTPDIDYILDPSVPQGKKHRGALQKAIDSVAKSQDIWDLWINSNMEILVWGDDKQRLFDDSVAQGVVLWQGDNLIIYAAKWEWSLARKLNRVACEDREVDVDDAVEILARMVQDNGGPLSWDTVKSWDTIIYSQLEDCAIKCVAEAYRERYGSVGIKGKSPE